MAAGQQIQQALEVTNTGATCFMQAHANLFAQSVISEVHLSSPVCGCGKAFLLYMGTNTAAGERLRQLFFNFIPYYGIKNHFLATIEAYFVIILPL